MCECHSLSTLRACWRARVFLPDQVGQNRTPSVSRVPHLWQKPIVDVPTRKRGGDRNGSGGQDCRWCEERHGARSISEKVGGTPGGKEHNDDWESDARAWRHALHEHTRDRAQRHTPPCLLLPLLADTWFSSPPVLCGVVGWSLRPVGPSQSSAAAERFGWLGKFSTHAHQHAHAHERQENTIRTNTEHGR